MSIFTATLTAPIEQYLQLAQTELAVDIVRGCIVRSDMSFGVEAGLIPTKYQIQPYGSLEFRDAVRSSAAISCLYSGTVSAVVAGGSPTSDHRYRIISAAGNYAQCLFNRDFAIAVIKHGLETDEIGFSGYGWTGRFLEIAKTPASYDQKDNLYECSGSILINLDRGGICQ
jgi:hypothetical protein